MAGPRQCFISYAHQDHAACERLLVHMKAVAALYPFPIWDDQLIHAGARWNDSIFSEIDKSDLFICLTTNDFFASDFIRTKELPAMYEKYNQNEALIVPVVYQDSCWQQYFGNFIQAVPTNHKRRLQPVRKWKSAEDGFAAAANAVDRAIRDWFGVEPQPLFAGAGAAL